MDEYTGGTIATMVVVPLLVVACLAAASAADRTRRARVREAERRQYFWATVAAVVAAFVVVGCTVWGMYPWRAEYHEYRQVSGTVISVDARTVTASGGGIEEMFVVRFSGDPREYGVLDTRAAAARVGDRLTVLCVRRWQWSGTHGHDCEFVDLAEVGR